MISLEPDSLARLRRKHCHFPPNRIHVNPGKERRRHKMCIWKKQRWWCRNQSLIKPSACLDAIIRCLRKKKERKKSNRSHHQRHRFGDTCHVSPHCLSADTLRPTSARATSFSFSLCSRSRLANSSRCCRDSLNCSCRCCASH